MSVRRWLERAVLKLVGWWRLQWGFCPWCNSSAPEIDECDCCSGYRRPYHPPGPFTIDMWRHRFKTFMQRGYWD